MSVRRHIGHINKYQIRYFVGLDNSVLPEEESVNNLIESVGDSNSTQNEEQCDYTYLSLQTCEDLGYSGGILSYKSGCILDTYRCINDSSYETTTVNDLNSAVEGLNGEGDKGSKLNGIIKNSLVANTLFYSLVMGILILMFFIIITLVKIRKLKRSLKL